MNQSENLEQLTCIVERVTFHNEQNGWSVLKVTSFRDPSRLTTVLIHQAKVFAGATMEFWGAWVNHPKHGEQFKAVRAVEKKPASAAALEKYLGSGLIKGIGPATAKKIVGHFKDDTLEIFENKINELMSVPGIAEKKLEQIKDSWEEHRSIRDVMMFLQGYGISTLFATKIYKTYNNKAIQIISDNPYRLAHDIYGIGFFSADKIALAMGFERTGELRIEAGIKHVLSASREEGHCFLTDAQIVSHSLELLRESLDQNRILEVLENLLSTNQIFCRKLYRENQWINCYYSKGLYIDEQKTAHKIKNLLTQKVVVDSERVTNWVKKYCEKNQISLSEEQNKAVCGIAAQSFSILTGGPGVGKTTCTKVLVQLLLAMKKQVILAAPTGRASQRMTEVIGIEAKTIHRLLEWAPDKNGFKKDDQDPLKTDFLIVDETSMLDISLAAHLLQAIPHGAQVLFIGDPDQLPAVSAGDVIMDLLKTQKVPRFRLTQVFRQAQASAIVRYAHDINSGSVPKIISPLARPSAFSEGNDCLFVDADEATQDQIKFMDRARYAIEQTLKGPQEGYLIKLGEEWQGRLQKTTEGVEVDPLYRPDSVSEQSVRAPVLIIPEKFKHVDLTQLSKAESTTKELMSILKSVHPWSSLHYGLNALDTVVRLYTKSIPEWLGKGVEIQILTPQVRGTLGTLSLNESLQRVANPESSQKKQIQIGAKIFRIGDRVIQTRNNYDLGVFNGDIGRISNMDTEDVTCEVSFSGGGDRVILFEKEDLIDLSLAYAITIHKSQGSEFQAVIIPVLGQHFNMLYRNLIYTGLTRAKKLAIFVGSRKAFAMAVGQIDNRSRQTALADLIENESLI